MTTSF